MFLALILVLMGLSLYIAEVAYIDANTSHYEDYVVHLSNYTVKEGVIYLDGVYIADINETESGTVINVDEIMKQYGYEPITNLTTCIGNETIEAVKIPVVYEGKVIYLYGHDYIPENLGEKMREEITSSCASSNFLLLIIIIAAVILLFAG